MPGLPHMILGIPNGLPEGMFQHLAGLFEMKKSDTMLWETTYGPITVATTHQKPSEYSHKARDHETAVKKVKSAPVEESHDTTCCKPKHNREKRATGRMSEQGAAARGLGEEATDQGASGMSLATMPSSQDDNGRDPEVRCMHVVSQEPQTASQMASEAAADAANPNAMSARPTEPAGSPPKLQVEPHEIAGDNMRGQGLEVNQGVKKVGEGQMLAGRTGEQVAAVRGPGEGAADQKIDGISLAVPASSPNGVGEDVHHTNNADEE
ncbi:hypothetical protein BU15DRAFT_67834 [Melanogaster broomeanus]|nr:hypothetical protein BU15DRAFT_67834 [Melanogaster broomeanus]